MVLPRIEPDKAGEHSANATRSWRPTETGTRKQLKRSCHCLPITWVWWPAKKDSSRYLSNSRDDGVPQEKLDLIKCPAGIDMPARTFPEVALSIVAEIVTLRRSQEKQGGGCPGDRWSSSAVSISRRSGLSHESRSTDRSGQFPLCRNHLLFLQRSLQNQF